MDRFGSPTQGSQTPNGPSDWLNSLVLNSLHAVLEAIGELRGTVGQLQTNQSTNRRDIIDRFEFHQEQHARQMADLRIEIAQIRSTQAAPASPEKESSLAKSLFGVVGVFLIEVIPWKHVALMMPWAAIALFGHLMPEQTKAVLVKIAEKFAGS